MWSLLLLADTREDPLQRPEVIWGVVGLAVALLAGAAVIYAVDKWRKRAAAGASAADGAGALTSFRAMYESGEITEAEYAELRRRVAEKVKKPAPTADAPAPIGDRDLSPAKPGFTAAAASDRDLSPAKPGFTAAPIAPPAQSGERPVTDPPSPPGEPPESPPPPATA